ncbi:hypothetical protein B0H13DRAFT_1890664 [Mycena leptocephala]|nr:hypothetical protein B0H13DRAFT_1890664 [Mycena leptocephala]
MDDPSSKLVLYELRMVQYAHQDLIPPPPHTKQTNNDAYDGNDCYLEMVQWSYARTAKRPTTGNGAVIATLEGGVSQQVIAALALGREAGRRNIVNWRGGERYIREKWEQRRRSKTRSTVIGAEFSFAPTCVCNVLDFGRDYGIFVFGRSAYVPAAKLDRFGFGYIIPVMESMLFLVGQLAHHTSICKRLRIEKVSGDVARYQRRKQSIPLLHVEAIWVCGLRKHAAKGGALRAGYCARVGDHERPQPAPRLHRRAESLLPARQTSVELGGSAWKDSPEMPEPDSKIRLAKDA